MLVLFVSGACWWSILVMFVGVLLVCVGVLVVRVGGVLVCWWCELVMCVAVCRWCVPRKGVSSRVDYVIS